MVKFFETFEKNRKLSFAVTIIISILIFLFSSIPGNQETLPSSDVLPMIYHFSIFFLLAFFLLISIHGKKKFNTDYAIVAIIISIFYGILDELHQVFISFRHPSIGDILIDSTGVFTAFLAYVYLKKKLS